MVVECELIDHAKTTYIFDQEGQGWDVGGRKVSGFNDKICGWKPLAR